MGLRHIVTMTFRDDTTPEQVDAIVTTLRELPDLIPEIESYVVGVDAGLADGNADLAVVADFASVADYEIYRDHPAHRAVITQQIVDVLAGRSALQHHT